MRHAPDARLALIRLWGIQLDGSVLSELEEGVRDEIVAELPDHILAAAVQEAEPLPTQ